MAAQPLPTSKSGLFLDWRIDRLAEPFPAAGLFSSEAIGLCPWSHESRSNHDVDDDINDYQCDDYDVDTDAVDDYDYDYANA